MAEIVFQEIQKIYGSRHAVKDLNLTVNSGELLCLLGPSGCGKTTTLRMLAGFIDPDGGDVRIEDKSVLKLGPEQRPTAMVFQRYTLWPHMNIEHNIAFGLKLRRMSVEVIRKKVGEVLELVGLPGVEKRYPNQLSGGQQQRIALARALVIQPKVLLLDEPLSSLDAKLRVQLREEIKSIQRKLGITTVFVTHDQEEALSVADRIAVMNQGLLDQLDTPGKLYDQPATRFVANFIGRMNFIPARYTGGRVQAGPFELSSPSLPGGDLELAFRPEDLEFDPNGAKVTVGRVIDLGPYRQVHIRTEDGHELMVFQAKDRAVHPAVKLRRGLVYQGEKLLTELAGAEPERAQ
ncbi:MAG: ABC transporter ATP-binding protein [Meiothermus sp.]|nr:ABC transporter ATP-binding protein [Meiothermus sp.]